MATTLEIGIVGARGIGKHHAKWFAQAGCAVTAVYGTSEASAAAAARTVAELTGSAPIPFHHWDRFLREGAFSACSVCSPAEQHYANVRDLAAAGKHILCEKPLVWNWKQTPDEKLAEATALVEACAHHQVLLGMNAQYPAALEGFIQLHREAVGGEPDFSSLSFVMETRGKPRSPHGAAEVWVDLGPHPLAFIDRVAPGGIDWETLRCGGTEHAAVLDFQWVSGARRIPVHVECRRTPDGTMRRLIGAGDFIARYDGLTEGGAFRARLQHGEHSWTGSDFMQVSVERFAEAVRTGDERRLLVNGVAALRQQEALAGVWQHCWR